MKIRQIISNLFLIFTAVLMLSCEFEPVDTSLLDATSTGGTTTGGTNSGGTSTGFYLKVTKDGIAKQWTTIEAINATVLNSFIITAADPSSSMSLSLFSVSKAGVYKLSYVEISATYTEGLNIFSSNYSDFTESAGNITITELNKTNKTIKGTFNFTGKNDPMTVTKVFTKGEFFTKYTEQ